ncbi:hypothetical protein TIFTF001_010373 [Ficus carica]|uniref:Uncharacterized protein n=1 Tax=Ficus carica TaxID=3494 RepID=A0AA87ZX73_FICCA|nr:hypothetical protein TIFTF001_010373 [Ficus carica]
MLKSLFPTGSGVQVTLMDRISSGPDRLVPAQAANTVSVQSGGGGWHRSRNNDKYSDSTERSGKDSMGQPTQRELGRGRGSVARVSTLDPDGGLLEVSRGELILGIGSPTEVMVSQLGNPRRFCKELDLSGLVRSFRVIGFLSSGPTYESTCSRALCSPVAKWSPTTEILPHHQILKQQILFLLSKAIM